jgi:uridine phosphorylase
MSQNIPSSELIINPDGSIYHLGLLPEQLCKNIITVGDPDRVDHVAKYFDRIFYTHQVREFRTVAGELHGESIMVISTGIGTDNIDIVLNELHALANIDFNTKKKKEKHTVLSICRLGTSGALRKEIKIDSILVSEYAVGLDGLMHFYKRNTDKFINNLESSINKIVHKSIPQISCYVEKNSHEMMIHKLPKTYLKGCTLTATGFYGPQGRKLSAPLNNTKYLAELRKWHYKKNVLSNFEMETAGIYGLANVLGHHAISFNAILANRESFTFSKNPTKTVDKMIKTVLPLFLKQGLKK